MALNTELLQDRHPAQVSRRRRGTTRRCHGKASYSPKGQGESIAAWRQFFGRPIKKCRNRNKNEHQPQRIREAIVESIRVSDREKFDQVANDLTAFLFT